MIEIQILQEEWLLTKFWQDYIIINQSLSVLAFSVSFFGAKTENLHPSFLDKALAAFSIAAEMLDMFGDISYLIWFPHYSRENVIILCFSLFVPFAVTFYIVKP